MAQSWVAGDSRNLEIPRAHRPGLAVCAHWNETLDPTAPLDPQAVYPQVISQTLPLRPCLQPGGAVGKLASSAGLAKGRISTWASRAQRDSFLGNPSCLVQRAAPSLLPQCSGVPHSSQPANPCPAGTRREPEHKFTRGVEMGPEGRRQLDPAGQRESQVKV